MTHASESRRICRPDQPFARLALKEGVLRKRDLRRLRRRQLECSIRGRHAPLAQIAAEDGAVDPGVVSDLVRRTSPREESAPAASRREVRRPRRRRRTPIRRRWPSPLPAAVGVAFLGALSAALAVGLKKEHQAGWDERPSDEVVALGPSDPVAAPSEEPDAGYAFELQPDFESESELESDAEPVSEPAVEPDVATPQPSPRRQRRVDEDDDDDDDLDEPIDTWLAASFPNPGPAGESARPADSGPADPDEPEVVDTSSVVRALHEAWSAYVDGATHAQLVPHWERVGEVAEQAPEAAEVHAFRGLLAFARRDFEASLPLLREGRSALPTLDTLHAQARWFLAQDDALRLELDGDDLPGWLHAGLSHHLEGPFAAAYPLASEALVTRSPLGRYRVVSDLGLDARRLARLERSLAKADPEDRPRMIASFRKRHRGLHEVAATLDKVSKAFQTLFAEEQVPQVVPTVYVFANGSEFREFLAGFSAKAGRSEHVLGVYQRDYRSLLFYDDGGPAARRGGLMSQETFATLVHETFHQWLHLFLDDAPAWFNEGLAEYFAGARLTGKGLRYGLPHKERLTLLWGGCRGKAGYPKPIPLRDLVARDHARFGSGLEYEQAWSFVHMLAAEEATRRHLVTYYQGLRQGVPADELNRMLLGAFATTDLTARWTDHVFHKIR